MRSKGICKHKKTAMAAVQLSMNGLLIAGSQQFLEKLVVLVVFSFEFLKNGLLLRVWESAEVQKQLNLVSKKNGIIAGLVRMLLISIEIARAHTIVALNSSGSSFTKGGLTIYQL